MKNKLSQVQSEFENYLEFQKKIIDSNTNNNNFELSLVDEIENRGSSIFVGGWQNHLTILKLEK